jgi:hypothetical protein
MEGNFYKKRAKFLFLETRNRYKLYMRLFQGLVVAVVCFLIVFLNQRRDIKLASNPPSEVVYSLKPNLLRDGKFQSTLNFSKSGTAVIVFPLATPQHLKQISDHEDGLQLYVSKSSFYPSPKQENLLKLKSIGTQHGQNERSADHHDPRFDTETLNTPAPDFENLITLFAAFSRWADQKQFPYWLAHANLLGWYWESKTLSWDDAINVHLPANILFDMMEFNGTLWSDRVYF